MNRKQSGRTSRAGSAPSAMPGETSPPWLDMLDDVRLEAMCGAAVFDRGLDLANEGCVQVDRITDAPHHAADAIVEGGSRYRVKLWIDGDRLHGDCNCPYTGTSPLCKHAVATAIVWRRRAAPDSGVPPERLEEAAQNEIHRSASPRRGRRSTVDERASLRSFLDEVPRTALVDRLLSFADRDADIERELRLWRDVERSDPSRQSVDALIARMLAPGRGFIDLPRTAAWANRARGAVALLERLRGSDPVAAATVGMRALRAGWKAIEQADDSYGEMGEVCTQLGAAWIASLRAAGPRPASFGKAYLDLLLDDPFDTFDAEAAESAFGPEALASFRDELAQRWRTARSASIERHRAEQEKSRGRASRYVSPFGTDDPMLAMLERHHLRQLEAEDDIDGMVSVLRAELDGPHAWHRLIALLETQGRHVEALEASRQAYDSHPADWRIRADRVRCLERSDAFPEVFRLCRAWFDEAPSFDRYRAALQAGAAAGTDEAALRDALLETMAADEARQGTGARDTSERIRVLVHEARLDDALALLRRPGARCRAEIRHDLARRLGPQRSDDAVALLEGLLQDEMRRASSPYRHALALVGEIVERLEPSSRPAWLNRVRATWPAKRNFIAGLPR